MGSLSVAAQSGSDVSVKVSKDKPLIQGSDNRQTFDVTGPSQITVPGMQIAAQGTIFLSENFLFGLGIEGTSKESIKWFEAGVRFGKEISFAYTMAAGSMPLQSDATWNVKTSTSYRNAHSGKIDTTVVTVRQQDLHSDDHDMFVRIGIHLASRQGGPWGELQFIRPTLLTGSPSCDDSWSANLTELGVGWSEPTRFGTATGYLRTVFGNDEVIPIVGLQWTGEFSLF